MRWVAGVLSILLAFAVSSVSAAPQRPVGPARHRLEFPADKGEAKIDVGFYPKEMQASLSFYRRMCSRCHTIARANNTSMTVVQWETYLRERLMKKRNSRIDDMAADKLLTFLRYDQQKRRDTNPTAFFPPVTLERWFKDGRGVPASDADGESDDAADGETSGDGEGEDASRPE